MTPPAMACWITEPDGTLVSHGTAHLRTTPQMREILVTDVDQPGQLVHRCLLGPVRSILLYLQDGACLAAQVERVFFDPQLGRTCVLQVGATRNPTDQRTPMERRELTPEQRAVIQALMRMFVEEDLGSGITARYRIHCAACRQPRPMPGFLYYAPHFLCNRCGTAYEVARAGGLVQSAGQFVRDTASMAAASASFPAAPAPDGTASSSHPPPDRDGRGRA